jgi:hypothetical protein
VLPEVSHPDPHRHRLDRRERDGTRAGVGAVEWSAGGDAAYLVLSDAAVGSGQAEQTEPEVTMTDHSVRVAVAL